MSVIENLDMGSYSRPRSQRSEIHADLERVLDLFPGLAERRTRPAARSPGASSGCWRSAER